jgi:hypothetical protein
MRMVKMTTRRRVKPQMVLSKKNEKGRRGRRRSQLSKRKILNSNRKSRQGHKLLEMP